MQPSSFLPPVSALPEPVPVAATFQSQPQFRPMTSQQTAARPQFSQQLETQQMRPPLQSHRKMQQQGMTANNFFGAFIFLLE